MNIYALKGYKLACSNLTNGYKHHQDIARKHLTIGNIYTVEKTEVDSSHTTVYLKEIPNTAFNSVFFEDISEQSEDEDKKHPDYSKYN